MISFLFLAYYIRVRRRMRFHPLHLIIVLSSRSHRRFLLPLPPIKPTSSVIPDVLIPSLLSLLTSGRTPLAGSTVEDDLLVGQRFVEHVFLDKGAAVVGGREVFLEDAEGKGYGAGDGSESDLVGFTDV
jgi:hypothetical protein